MLIEEVLVIECLEVVQVDEPGVWELVLVEEE